MFKTPHQKLAMVCKVLAKVGGELVEVRSSTEMGSSFQFYMPA